MAHFEIKLPHSGAFCETGPVLTHKREKVSLSYDARTDDDEICWSQIKIDGVLATKFTPELSTTEEMSDAYDRVLEIPESQWIQKIHDAASERCLTLSPETKHYMIFFDHFGCFEFAARGQPRIIECGPNEV